MTGECKCCGRVKELRLGHCWECAEAESIIDEGLDMRDKGIVVDGVERPAQTPMEKLKMLVSHGWSK